MRLPAYREVLSYCFSSNAAIKREQKKFVHFAEREQFRRVYSAKIGI